MIIVGLTGGIAAGKTTVAKILENKGAIVINADEIARQVVRPSRRAWEKIVNYFGPHVLKSDETINRQALARIVFFDPEARRALDRITHPEIAEVMKKRLKRLKARSKTGDSLVVLDVPLLIEAGLTHLTDYIMAVEADNDIRLARLESQGFSFSEALARMEAQISVYERERFADCVIHNNGSPVELEAEVEKCLEDLRKTSSSPRSAAR